MMSRFLEKIVNFDTAIFFHLNAWAGQSSLFDSLIIFFGSFLGAVLLVIFFIAINASLMSFEQKIRHLTIGILSSLIARFGITVLIRILYARPRPFLLYHVHQLIPEHGGSIPSGHASFFFALSAAVFLWNKRLGLFFFAASLLMGIARIVVGVHFPLDIIAGILVGVVTAWAVNRILSFFQNRQTRKSYSK